MHKLISYILIFTCSITCTLSSQAAGVRPLAREKKIFAFAAGRRLLLRPLATSKARTVFHPNPDSDFSTRLDELLMKEKRAKLFSALAAPVPAIMAAAIF